MQVKSQKESVQKYDSDFVFRLSLGDPVLEYYRQSLFRLLRVSETPLSSKAVVDRMEERGFEQNIISMLIRNSADHGDIGFGKGFHLVDQTNHPVSKQDIDIEVDFITKEKERLLERVKLKDLEISNLDLLIQDREQNSSLLI